jgi:hypothetical protein
MKSKNIVKRQNPEAKAAKPVRWKPASRLGIVTRPDGYRVRWCSDTPENIARKKAEGWEILDKTKFPKLENSEFDHRTTDSSGITKTVVKRNELIAMIIPEDMAQERDTYYQQETENQTQRALSHEEVKKLVSKADPRYKRNIQSVNPQGISEID